MDTRWLTVLVVFAGLVMLALFMMSTRGPREMRAGQDRGPAVRRFGRRKGEPRPAWRRRELAASD